MKSILIVIYAHYVKLIIEGKKTVEVRKNKNLANAIKKLIAEQGGCWIYIYVAKGNEKLCRCRMNVSDLNVDKYKICSKQESMIYKDTAILNGKVVARFWCDKVEDIYIGFGEKFDDGEIGIVCEDFDYSLLDKSCLTERELRNYCKPIIYDSGDYYDMNIYAIHIAKLEVFDRPRELSEFKTKKVYQPKTNPIVFVNSLTKAPQNFTYIESEK